MKNKTLITLLINAYLGSENATREINKNYNEYLEQLMEMTEALDILLKWITLKEYEGELFPYELKIKNAYISNRSSLVLSRGEYLLLKRIKERSK